MPPKTAAYSPTGKTHKAVPYNQAKTAAYSVHPPSTNCVDSCVNRHDQAHLVCSGSSDTSYKTEKDSCLAYSATNQNVT